MLLVELKLESVALHEGGCQSSRKPSWFPVSAALQAGGFLSITTLRWDGNNYCFFFFFFPPLLRPNICICGVW